MSLRSHKQVEIMVYLNILLVDGKTLSGSVQIITDPDPLGPKTYVCLSGSGTLV
jgi:hypothetical protein